MLALQSHEELVEVILRLRGRLGRRDNKVASLQAELDDVKQQNTTLNRDLYLSNSDKALLNIEVDRLTGLTRQYEKENVRLTNLSCTVCVYVP